jgi:Leucine-rich repeat (LRR) protein
MYRYNNNLYCNAVDLDNEEYLRQISLITDKENIKVLNVSNNHLTGFLPIIQFPNLKELYIQNNKITGFTGELPKTLKKLCIYNNHFTETPILPEKIKVFIFYGNPIKKISPLPVPVFLNIFDVNKRFYLSEPQFVNMQEQSYETKKSIILFLNKNKTKHSLSPKQLEDLQEFKNKERARYYFDHALTITRKENYKNIQSLHRSDPGDVSQYTHSLLSLSFVYYNVSFFLFF